MGRHLNASSAAQRAVKDLAPVFGLIGRSADAVLLPEIPREDEVPKCLRHVSFVSNVPPPPTIGMPFGWTPAARQVMAAANMALSHCPSLEAVRFVNGRRFNAEHDQVIADDGKHHLFDNRFGRICQSLGEWRESVLELGNLVTESWVTKPAISHAGRNRLLGRGASLNAQQEGWLKNRLSQDGYVYLEPWLQRGVEFGLQFDIQPDGRIEYVGAAQLINDSAGRYQGSVIGERAVTVPDQAVKHGLRVCESAYRNGYFGPLGIDCFQFRISGPDQTVRPMTRLCNDINARYTMGRLALQFDSELNPSECAFWGQFRADDFFHRLPSARNCSGQSFVNDVRVTVTSPRSIQGRAVRTITALLIASSESILHRVRYELIEAP